MKVNDREKALQIVLDKQDLYELIFRYCRALDRCDEELLRSVYHPDAIQEHGAFVGRAEDYCTHAIETLSRMGVTDHYILNTLFEIEGDVAFGEIYGIAYHRLEKDGEPFDSIVGARLIDRYERRDGEWRIAHRKTLMEWNQDLPAGDTWTRGVLGPPPEPGMLPKKDKTDLSYQRK